MIIKLPHNVNRIIDTLSKAGFEAYAVGGCVRDSILGRTPNDWDITTQARPEEVKALFKRTVDTGIAHGTVTVLIENESFEVTTYRIDGEYEYARRPKSVSYTRSLEEDLARRDFTINAMAYNESRGLIDIFGGMDDIKDRMIRCVGNPEERFTEDALRMLRCIRFAAQLGFTIEFNTFGAIQPLTKRLSFISGERIQAEMVKLSVSPYPEYWRQAYRSGITRVIFREFDRMIKTDQNTPYHLYSVGEHTLRSMSLIEPDKVLRLAMLFHDVGKPECIKISEHGLTHFPGHHKRSRDIAIAIMQKLHFDNATIRKVAILIMNHDHVIEPTRKAVRRAVVSIGEELFPALLKVQYADNSSKSEGIKAVRLERIRQVERIYQEILADNECLSVKNLAVNGDDLINIGFPSGKELGNTLRLLFDAVINNPKLNDREILLKMAGEIYANVLRPVQ